MPELHTLAIFAAASAAFLAVPGPSVIYIVSRSLAEGRTAGVVSALGIQTGGLVCAYVGLGLLAALSPGSSSSAHELMQ
jgi:threonine/homoserine/homoserine lactone efflux protein